MDFILHLKLPAFKCQSWPPDHGCRDDLVVLPYRHPSQKSSHDEAPNNRLTERPILDKTDEDSAVPVIAARLPLIPATMLVGADQASNGDNPFVIPSIGMTDADLEVFNCPPPLLLDGPVTVNETCSLKMLAIDSFPDCPDRLWVSLLLPLFLLLH